jgi:hypothetical protein
MNVWTRLKLAEGATPRPLMSGPVLLDSPIVGAQPRTGDESFLASARDCGRNADPANCRSSCPAVRFLGRDGRARARGRDASARLRAGKEGVQRVAAVRTGTVVRQVRPARLLGDPHGRASCLLAGERPPIPRTYAGAPRGSSVTRRQLQPGNVAVGSSAHWQTRVVPRVTRAATGLHGCEGHVARS